MRNQDQEHIATPLTETNGNQVKATSFFFFIALLRSLATCLITNTHYDNIWPVSSLAVGGLIGDILFFAISGFCLINVGKKSILHWYGKRIIRIYPSVIVVTVILVFLNGTYHLGWRAWLQQLIYPTNYPFVSSIVLLYLFFYFIGRYQKLKENIPLLMLIITAIWLAIYYGFADKTVKLDTAEHPLTKFIFFEAMLFGGYVRLNTNQFVGRNSLWKWITTAGLLVAYFASILVIRKFQLLYLQPVIMVLVFLGSMAIFVACCGIENQINRSKFIVKLTGFVAPLTLEIYIVQRYIISKVQSLIFPLNFIVCTCLILLSAFVINRVINLCVDNVVKAIKKPTDKRDKKSDT